VDVEDDGRPGKSSKLLKNLFVIEKVDSRTWGTNTAPRDVAFILSLKSLHRLRAEVNAGRERSMVIAIVHAGMERPRYSFAALNARYAAIGGRRKKCKLLKMYTGPGGSSIMFGIQEEKHRKLGGFL
jgi:hypothetical protein